MSVSDLQKVRITRELQRPVSEPCRLKYFSFVTAGRFFASSADDAKHLLEIRRGLPRAGLVALPTCPGLFSRGIQGGQPRALTGAGAFYAGTTMHFDEGPGQKKGSK